MSLPNKEVLNDPNLEVPEDFKDALIATELLEKFEKLSPSHRREHIFAIEEAKKPETRERRILKAIEMLQSK
jgi:uncharacterized protein YdeI (YjbR/CyaY-like superfamily)